MPLTIPLRVQQNGSFGGYESIVGTTYAWQAVDDSDGTTHDSDTSYIVIGSVGQGKTSFPLFLQCQPGQPISVLLRVAAKLHQGLPELDIGFTRASGQQVFDGTTFSPGASYSTTTRTFNVNPFTQTPWDADDFVGLEACVRMHTGIIAKARVTLISGQLTAAMPTNPARRSLDRWVTA